MMKELSDTEIQELMSRGGEEPGDLSPEDAQEINTYRFLFKALDTPPLPSLPADFAARMAAGLVQKKKPYADLGMFLAIAAVFIVLLAAAYLYTNAGSGGQTSHLLLTLLKYKWMGIFALVAVCLIQFADHRLVLRRQPGF